MKKEFHITDESQLCAVAEYLLMTADRAQKESAVVVALHGDLGVGKTTLVQLIAQLLNITAPVTSPTFTIMNTYELDHAVWKQLVHIDA